MRILYLANNIRGVVCLKRLHEENFNIIGVVPGKMPNSDEHSVQKYAESIGYPVLFFQKINSTEAVRELKKLDIDLIIMSGYTQILKSNVLAIPKLGSINLHGGRLPYYRGASPINWQIINGETTGACAILYVDDGIDTGPIIIQREYPIDISDTAATVLEKTLNIFPDILVEALRGIEKGTVTPIHQDPSAGAYYTSRYPHDGLIDWKNMTAIQAYNLIRAVTRPYPGGFSYYKNEKIIIWSAELLKEIIYGVPGRIALKRPHGVVVIAKDKGLLIKEIQVGEKSNPISAREYFHCKGENLSSYPTINY